MATQVSDTSAKTRTRGTADDLAVIAQRAQAFTSASGTAIALSDGNSDEITCRARSGSAAPEVGTVMRVEGSFTGLCIQSGKELRCDDTETDTRVDTSGIRALGIRSMVVAPIKEDNRVVGVLAVFAPTAHAFTITHVAVLKTMADQIGQLLQKRRTGGDSVQPESAAAAPVTVARPLPPAITPAIPAPVVIKPAVSIPPSAPRPVAPVITKVEPIRASAVVEPLAAPIAPKKEERRGESKAQFQSSPACFGTFDTVAADAGKSGNRWLLISAAALVVAAGSTFGYLKLRKPASNNASHTQSAAPVASVQPLPPVQPATSNPGSDASSASSPSSSAPAAKPKDNSAESTRRAENNSKPSPAAPETKRTPETVALNSAPSRIAGRPADSGQSSDTAPALTVGNSPGPGSLNSLASSMSAPTPSMITQSTLEPLTVIKRVSPVYPPVARQRLLSSTLVLEAVVDETGHVKNVKMISGSPIFREAAIDAVKQWVYQPAKLNGRPIEQTTTIQLAFKP